MVSFLTANENHARNNQFSMRFVGYVGFSREAGVTKMAEPKGMLHENVFALHVNFCQGALLLLLKR